MEVKPLEVHENCIIHEVVFNKATGEPASLLQPPEAPAKEFNFPLDAFQKEAIKCLNNKRTVFVSAHTSAGKSSVAE